MKISKQKIQQQVLVPTLVIGFTILSSTFFQNCMGISPEAIQSASMDAKISEIPTTPTTMPPVICDPLSGGAGCTNVPPKSGLIGNLYSYPNGVGVNEYINKGVKQNVLIQMSTLNIPLRAWTAGFPGPNGLVKNDSGEPLFEYFALDLKGYLTVDANYAGKYQFALASDDGAILDINGNEVVNNDGTHPVEWKCASTSENLVTGMKSPIRVRYYQGPRQHIAIQVMFRPWSKKDAPCNESGGFQILPSAFLSH